MKKLIFAFVFCVGTIGLFSVFVPRAAKSQARQDKIQYNVVYDCPAFNDAKGASSGRKFKVLRCDGENCKVFMINEYNPNGGFEIDMTKAHVSEDISRYRCVAPGDNKNADPQTKPEEQTPNEGQTQQPTTTNTNGKVACPASDPDSKGKSELERAFRGAIRQGWEKEPEPGLDGRVTITFQEFRVGAPHKYRIYADPNEAVGKTIYPVRATFTTCTDYNRRVEITKREREHACFQKTGGKWACTIIAAPNTNVKDKTESLDKPR